MEGNTQTALPTLSHHHCSAGLLWQCPEQDSWMQKGRWFGSCFQRFLSVKAGRVWQPGISSTRPVLASSLLLPVYFHWGPSQWDYATHMKVGLPLTPLWTHPQTYPEVCSAKPSGHQYPIKLKKRPSIPVAWVMSWDCSSFGLSLWQSSVAYLLQWYILIMRKREPG